MREARYYELAHIRARGETEVRLIFRRDRRSRAVGVGTAAGPFFAFGVTAISAPATAHADDFGLGDLISDLVAIASSTAVTVGPAGA